MDRQPLLEGSLLTIRPLRAEDWDAFYGAASDPLIWAQHPAHDRWQPDVCRAFFDDALAKGGAVAVIDRASGAFLGSSRWQAHNPDNGGSVEIGWTFLARGAWGGGYNREMKRLMLAHAFRYVARVDFRIGEGNLRSRVACERIGGRLSDRSDVAMMGGVPVRHVVYEITREAFESGPLAIS
ncbi:MAG TPA: GNAT family N-acetyltransferase [Novosphingobium sp.]|nr:GNAT family N-acetyltransferase [Novosphingobium sp.]